MPDVKLDDEAECLATLVFSPDRVCLNYGTKKQGSWL